MYHIKNDKRSKTSAEALYQALITLLKKEDIDKINITQLVNTAAVGRSTFYRNFDMPLDILKWKADLNFKGVLNSYIHSKKNEKDYFGFIRYVFTYWEDHSDVFESLINLRRMDIIYNSFNNASPIIINYMTQKNDLKNVNPVEFQYFLAMRIGILVSTMVTWINRGKKETPDEIVVILGKEVIQYKNMKVLF